MNCRESIIGGKVCRFFESGQPSVILLQPSARHETATLLGEAEQIAAQEGIALRKGVYVACTGPCYETPAEYRYFRSIGADAVGMSTTPEVIVARHSSIPVFGVSVITDVARDTDDEDYVTDGEAIVKAADAAADKMTLIFKRLIAEL